MNPEKVIKIEEICSKTENKKNYPHKFQERWLNDDRFSSWISKSTKDDSKAFCTACNCEVAGSVTFLERHRTTKKHLQNVNLKEKCVEVSFYHRQTESSEPVKHIMQIPLADESAISTQQAPIPAHLAVNNHQELPDFLNEYLVFRINDYIKFRSRKQFWEDSAVQRILQGIEKYEIDIHTAADILGVNSNTLYRRSKVKKLDWVPDVLVSEIEVNSENLPEQNAYVATETQKISSDDNLKTVFQPRFAVSVPTQSSTVFQKEMDEYEAIGANIASKLRKAEPQQVIFAERIIHEILFQAQMGNLTSNYTLKSSHTNSDNSS